MDSTSFLDSILEVSRKRQLLVQGRDWPAWPREFWTGRLIAVKAPIVRRRHLKMRALISPHLLQHHLCWMHGPRVKSMNGCHPLSPLLVRSRSRSFSPSPVHRLPANSQRCTKAEPGDLGEIGRRSAIEWCWKPPQGPLPCAGRCKNSDCGLSSYLGIQLLTGHFRPSQASHYRL